MNADVEKILSCLNEKEVVDIAMEMMAIPSVSGQEGKVAEFLQQEMKEMGFESLLQANPGYPDRPNAIGILKGDPTLRSVMLMGHMDIVPPAPIEEWKITKPFEPKLMDGRIYCHHHMKGGLAAMIMAANAVKKSGVGPLGDIILANVMGECDLYGLGTVTAVKEYKTDAGICLEPSGGHYIMTGHAGVIQLSIHVKGIHAHLGTIVAGASKRVNAIEKAARIVENINPSMLTYTAVPGVLDGLPQIMIGKIEGGRHPVFAASDCRIDVDVRIIDGMTIDSVKKDFENLIAKLKAKDPDLEASVEIWVPPKSMPRGPLNVSESEPIVQAIKEAHRKIYGNYPGVGSDIWHKTMVTDAAHMNTYGVPTPLYGPGGAGTAQEDTGADASIEVEDIMICAKVIAVALVDYCSKKK